MGEKSEAVVADIGSIVAVLVLSISSVELSRSVRVLFALGRFVTLPETVPFRTGVVFVDFDFGLLPRLGVFVAGGVVEDVSPACLSNSSNRCRSLRPFRRLAKSVRRYKIFFQVQK